MDFFVLDIERELAGEAGASKRDLLIEQFGQHLATVDEKLKTGLPAAEYAVANAWRLAMESSIRVVRDVIPKPLKLAS